MKGSNPKPRLASELEQVVLWRGGVQGVFAVVVWVLTLAGCSYSKERSPPETAASSTVGAESPEPARPPIEEVAQEESPAADNQNAESSPPSPVSEIEEPEPVDEMPEKSGAPEGGAKNDRRAGAQHGEQSNRGAGSGGADGSGAGGATAGDRSDDKSNGSAAGGTLTPASAANHKVPKTDIEAANRRAAKSLKLAETAVAAGRSAEAFGEALAGWKAVKAYEANDVESRRLTASLLSIMENTGEAANQKTKTKSSDSDRKTIEFR